MKQYIKLYDLLGFKVCWVLCAFCSVWEKPYLGPLVTLIFIIGHLLIVNFNFRDIKIIIVSIILGFIIDTLFLNFDFVNYKNSINYAPLWIIAIWAGFSITLIYTLDAPMCCVIPPASPAATLAFLIASNRLVFP